MKCKLLVYVNCMDFRYGNICIEVFQVLIWPCRCVLVWRSPSNEESVLFEVYFSCKGYKELWRCLLVTLILSSLGSDIVLNDLDIYLKCCQHRPPLAECVVHEGHCHFPSCYLWPYLMVTATHCWSFKGSAYVCIPAIEKSKSCRKHMICSYSSDYVRCLVYLMYERCRIFGVCLLTWLLLIMLSRRIQGPLHGTLATKWYFFGISRL